MPTNSYTIEFDDTLGSQGQGNWYRILCPDGSCMDPNKIVDILNDDSRTKHLSRALEIGVNAVATNLELSQACRKAIEHIKELKE